MLTVSWLLTDLTPSTLWANSVALFLAIILGAVPFNKTLPLVTSTLIFKALSSESAAKEELIAILKTYPENYLFVPLPEKFNYIPDFARNIVQQSGNYDYLFNIPIKSLTPKRIEDLTKRYQALYSEYQNLLNTTTVKMWLDDLLDFKQEYEKELKREKSKGLS